MTIHCSACGNYGHNKRNKTCPAKTHSIKPYIKPVILYNHIISEYYSIFDVNIPSEMISIMLAQDIIRWAYYSCKTKLYCVCNKGIKPPNDNDILIKIAFIIPKPTTALINIKAWELVYNPNPIVSSIQKECSICYDLFQTNQFITMNCNHSFCLSCIQGCIHSIKNTEQLPTCPMCRAIVTLVNVPDIPIYNTLAETLYQI
jgi:hypothetical protein